MCFNFKWFKKDGEIINDKSQQYPSTIFSPVFYQNISTTTVTSLSGNAYKEIPHDKRTKKLFSLIVKEPECLPKFCKSRSVQAIPNNKNLSIEKVKKSQTLKKDLKGCSRTDIYGCSDYLERYSCFRKKSSKELFKAEDLFKEARCVCGLCVKLPLKYIQKKNKEKQYQAVLCDCGRIVQGPAYTVVPAYGGAVVVADPYYDFYYYEPQPVVVYDYYPTYGVYDPYYTSYY